MNKKIFLDRLKKNLKELKAAEIQKHLNYYEELFSDMMENGLSEAEAIAKIGTPEKIAEEILENAAAEEFREQDTVGRVLTGMSIVLVVIAVLAKACGWVLPMSFSTSSTGTSIGIIGGADGPTSIFVAGKVGEPIALYALAATMITMTIIYKVYRRNKK